MRDQVFLDALFEEMRAKYFADVLVVNPIVLRFGRESKRRFGSIKMSNGKSLILLNGFFRDESVPEPILRATLAHELCHYAHGFSSNLPRKYEHPHRGGVIEREFRKRDLQALYDFEKKWTKENWAEYLKTKGFFARPRRVHRGLLLRKGVLRRISSYFF